MTVVLVLAFAGIARASTILGSRTQPVGSSVSGCGTNSVINQVTSDPSTPYSVPATGTITQWQLNTALDTPGAPVALVVLRPAGAGFLVVGVDSRTLPNPLPADNVATFVLATPIPVQAGDTFGLYTNSSASVVCYWNGGATPLAATLARLGATSPPAPNQALSRIIGDSPGGYTMNLAATFEPPATPTKKKCKKQKKHSASAAKKKCKKKKK